MDIISIKVLPGSPEVAETIDISMQSSLVLTFIELRIDGNLITTLKTDIDGDLNESINITGWEVEVANFGSMRRSEPKGFKIGQIFKLKEPLHNITLEII